MRGISIIVCCYNSALRLPATIKHICTQQVDVSTPWEVIIVNNNSSDNTAEVAQNLLNKYNCPVHYSIVSEPHSGLSYARAKGIATSCYDYLLFCDDDNWLKQDYVQTAYEIMYQNASIAVLGGQGIAACEVCPPGWFQYFPGIYAVGKPQKKSGYITSANGKLYGAGMVIRKSAWEHLLSTNYTFYLSDRKGKSLTSGGDSEICFALRLLGYELYYDERLVYQHFLPKERLEWKYVSKMSRGLGNSYAYLRVLMLVLKGEEINLKSWFRQLTKFTSYVLSPKMMYAYLKAIKYKDSWVVVSYPAHWYATIDWIYLSIRLHHYRKSIYQIEKSRLTQIKHTISEIS